MNRKPRWYFTHLDKSDTPIKNLDGVKDGRLNIQALSTIGASGHMSLLDLGQDINFLTDRVRVEYDPGTGERWPFGTLLMRSSDKTHYETYSVFQVELLAKTQILAEARIDYGFTIPEGANIVETIVALIESTGETRIAATHSPAELVNALVFIENETVLEVVNMLADAANYWAIWCDGEGQFRVEPYTNPKDRAIVHYFEAGEASLHLTGWTRTQDLASVPNVVKVRRPGTDDTPGAQGVARDDNPASPFSTVSRGYEVVYEYESEGADQDTLDNLALRYLVVNQAPVGKIEVTHAVLPLEQNQKVSFIDRGYDGTATVRNMQFDFNEFTQCQAEWVEV